MGAKRVLGVALVAGLILPLAPSAQAKASRAPRGMSVVALIDAGINPYADAFRDRSPLAYRHPSTYIPGYPKNAKALKLSLGLPFKKAFKKDRKIWEGITRTKLYWIPGTRIVGAISLDSGGTNCPPARMPPASYLSGNCREYPILDDHGHGTMTASRAAGAPRSLAPNARIVEIEGLGSQSVDWAADQGWIDVQSNSWIDFLPPPIPSGTSRAFEEAAARMLTLAASGNGTAYITGFAPTPTYVLSTAAPGVVLVGGHDNGKMTLWAGAPPHVVADAYAGFTALRDSTEGMRPHPMACCTSAASPYAAGGAAAIVAEARRLLGHPGTGIKAGLVACGDPGRIERGPLKDGVFTLPELKTLLMKTAQPHPAEGRDDGRIHWAGDPRPPDNTEYGPGGNPFCVGCTTTPVSWKDIPDDGDAAFPLIGYGGINEHSVALAKSVLSGKKPLPDRPAADAQYSLDQEIREVMFSRNSPNQQPPDHRIRPPCQKG